MPEIAVDLSLIRNIIFDLGGVILNLNVQKSVDALQQLSRSGQQVPFSLKSQSDLFDALETGAIAPAEFRRRLREEFDVEGDDDALDTAWNAMLLDLPAERIELLQQLGQTHRLFLLSNTNAIHLLRFTDIFKNSVDLPSLDSLFEKTYYSHLIGRRKPHPEVFNFIVAENNLDKVATLFIDDSYQHIEGARQAGIQALHLQPPLTITDVFQHAI
jgi:HAD superfamily hydrolase (TIGR01509 family)